MIDVRWVWAFLDTVEGDSDASEAFWHRVTRTNVSPRRGEHGEFATLLPGHGEAWVKVQRVRDDWTDRGDPPATARELFEMAASGSKAARRHVEKHAIDIGRIAASVVSIFDPGLIVMGGGVGQNELLLPLVRDVIAELTWQTEVTTSQLPARGTVLGASQLAVREAVQILTGTEHLPVYGEE